LQHPNIEVGVPLQPAIEILAESVMSIELVEKFVNDASAEAINGYDLALPPQAPLQSGLRLACANDIGTSSCERRSTPPLACGQHRTGGDLLWHGLPRGVCGLVARVPAPSSGRHRRLGPQGL
jgi:hypothetical protein